jgi:predicted transcriptional regulator
MRSTTVRITEDTHRALRELAQWTNEPMQQVLARAVEAYRREQLLHEVNASFAALRADPEAWAEEEADRALWDATLADGLGPG